MYMYIHMYVCVCVYIYIYTYTYIHCLDVIITNIIIIFTVRCVLHMTKKEMIYKKIIMYKKKMISLCRTLCIQYYKKTQTASFLASSPSIWCITYYKKHEPHHFWRPHRLPRPPSSVFCLPLCAPGERERERERECACV